MGLTAAKKVDLEDAGLIKFLGKDKNRWLGKATNAYTYTSQFVKDTGEDVRPDDLIDPLVSALQVDTKLHEYLAEKRLSQKYWFTYFAELIVDEFFDQLKKDGGQIDG
jgi:hypothetical protein